MGNELAVYDEYPSHPQAGEGPWHLLPKGPVVGSSETAPAQVQAYRCAVGERLVVRGRIDGLLRYTQTLTLWDGVDRLDCRTTIDEFTGEDRLVRLRWPTPVPGAMPVSEVGDAVVGRGFASDPPTGFDASVDTARPPVDPGKSRLRLVRAVVGGTNPCSARMTSAPYRLPRW